MPIATTCALPTAKTLSRARSTERVVRVALIVLFCAAMLAAVALISASTASAASGGTGVQIRPKITKVKCVRSCVRRKRTRIARGGSLIRVYGSDLDQTTQVKFYGSRGKRDDLVVKPFRTRSRVLTVRIPADSTSGRLAARTAAGISSKQRPYLTILPRPPVIGTPDLKPVAIGVSGFSLEAGTSTPRSVFLGAKQLVRYSLRLSGPANATATVTLRRLATGEVASTWTVPAPNGQVVSVDWDGNAGGSAAAPGRYAFSVAINSDIASLASAKPSAVALSRDAFDLHEFRFPVRGRFNFGQRGARFGGGRGHQGQDVMARCRTKLVAARGGVVVESRRQSAAGNFIVIRPDDASVGDQAYMHMIRRSPFRKGDRVYTGQQIGQVGSTGRSSACHLHFEQWTGKIWRSRPVDPLPQLKAASLVR